MVELFIHVQVCLFTKQLQKLVKFLCGSDDKESAYNETWVLSMGWENHLAKEMATHVIILAWEIPWTEEAGCLQSMGSQRVRHD